MESVDFLFLIEHEDREMAVAQRLKKNLIEAGFDVSILSIEFHSHLFEKITPKNIIFPYAISHDTWPIKYFLKKRFRTSNFISLNWEQLLSPSNQEFKKPKGNLLQDNFYHLAWDESFKDFLICGGVSSENISIIGNPLHELLYEDISRKAENLLKLKTKFGSKLDNEVVFFPMNYGWAFFDDKKIEAKINQGYDNKVAYEYRNYSKCCLERYIDFIVKIALNNLDKTFVIRPHPSISEEQYLECFESKGLEIPSNILITKKFTIKEWISISCLVGSSWSTSVWDAIKVGRSGFLFTPYPRPDWLETFWNSMVTNISSSDEFQLLNTLESNNAKNCDNIISNITRWLIEISKKNKEPLLFSFSFKQYLICLLYTFRSRLRFYSMLKTNGLGVNKGLKRDFFKPQI